MDGQRIFELAIGAGLLWLIVSFYWLRVVTCAGLLAAWGSVAIVAPAYFALRYFGEGAVFSGILTCGLLVMMGFFWWIGTKAALTWARDRDRYGKFWLPWNAR